MKVRWKSGTTTKDITKYVESVEWEGSDTQVSRTATLSVIFNYDKKVYVNIKNGDLIYLNESKDIFVGVVTYCERTGDVGTVSYTVKDFMHYLLRSQGSYNFKKTTPEKITKKVCADLLIQTGSLYATKTYLKSKLYEDETYYNIIVDSYNSAAKKMSGKYPPAFMSAMNGIKLNVIIKGQSSGITLDSKNDITSSDFSQDTESMVNTVSIVNDKGTVIGTVSNASNVKKYGVYKSIYKKEDGVNAKSAAKQLLTGVSKEATIEAIGYTQCIAGYSVIIKDAATNLKGKFYIQSDKHTWKDGVHTMQLTLKFSNELEEVT